MPTLGLGDTCDGDGTFLRDCWTQFCPLAAAGLSVRASLAHAELSMFQLGVQNLKP